MTFSVGWWGQWNIFVTKTKTNRGVTGGKEDSKTMQRAEETIINILEERREYIHFLSDIPCMI